MNLNAQPRGHVGLLFAMVISISISTIAYLISHNASYIEQLYAVEAYELFNYGKIPSRYPLFPTLMAASLCVFGVTKVAFLIVPFLSVLFLVLLVYLLSLKVFHDRQKATLSALIVASNPTLSWLSSKGMSEPLFSTMLVLTMLFLTQGEPSSKRMLLVGFLSSLAFSAKIAGLWLFLYIPAFILLKKGGIRPLLSFFAPIVAILLPYPKYTLDTILGLRWLLSPPGVETSLLPHSIPNVVIGYGLLLGYCIPLLCPFLARIARKPSPNASNVPFYYALTYCLFITPYYVWDPFRDVSLSASNLARYAVPVFPLIAIYADHPLKGKKGWVITALCIIAGIALSIYLVHYADVHAVGTSWEEFLNRLR